MISLEDLGPLVYGAGALNNLQYADGKPLDVVGALRTAFTSGIKAVDTSAYYGQSEVLLGQALKELSSEFSRHAYFLITKAGRWEDNTFDYTPESINRSVERSLQRLHTDYIDLLLIHDVEFQTEDQAISALITAFDLKKAGKVRYVGFSGYPLDYLVKIAEMAQMQAQPVDAVLTYCNLTLQNSRLLTVAEDFKKAGVKTILNASPLSMSLLRSQSTVDWHPASQEVKLAAKQISEDLKARGIELADVAEQYSFHSWDGPTIIGFRSSLEVKQALENLRIAQKNPKKDVENEVIAKFGVYHNQTWPSGRIE